MFCFYTDGWVAGKPGNRRELVMEEPGPAILPTPYDEEHVILRDTSDGPVARYNPTAPYSTWRELERLQYCISCNPDRDPEKKFILRAHFQRHLMFEFHRYFSADKVQLNLDKSLQESAGGYDYVDGKPRFWKLKKRQADKLTKPVGPPVYEFALHGWSTPTYSQHCYIWTDGIICKMTGPTGTASLALHMKQRHGIVHRELTVKGDPSYVSGIQQRAPRPVRQEKSHGNKSRSQSPHSSSFGNGPREETRRQSGMSRERGRLLRQESALMAGPSQLNYGQSSTQSFSQPSVPTDYSQGVPNYVQQPSPNYGLQIGPSTYSTGGNYIQETAQNYGSQRVSSDYYPPNSQSYAPQPPENYGLQSDPNYTQSGSDYHQQPAVYYDNYDEQGGQYINPQTGLPYND